MVYNTLRMDMFKHMAHYILPVYGGINYETLISKSCCRQNYVFSK